MDVVKTTIQLEPQTYNKVRLALAQLALKEKCIAD
jgi:hypothetical protein